MAITKAHCLVLTTLVIVGTMMMGDHAVHAQCEASIPALVSQCSQYVQTEGPKVPPSQGCCQAMTGVDIPCICRLVTPEVEKKVSMEKVVYVARTCGMTVEPGMQCGSYTVPPSA